MDWRLERVHWYRAFGLRIVSTIPLGDVPDTAPHDAPDVEIQTSPLPPTIEGLFPPTVLDGVSFASGPGRSLITLPGGSRVFVEEGRRITVDRRGTTDFDSIRTYVLGSGLGALLHQRGVLALHGSAIDTPHGAVIFVGQSGKGKSTLAASFHARGYRILSDDISAITLDSSGAPWVLPAYPRLKLTADAVTHPDIVVTPSSNEDGKVVAAIDDAFVAVPRRLHAIVHLRAFPVDQVSITRLDDEVARAVLRAHIFRRCLLRGLGLDRVLDRVVSGVVQAAGVYRTVRPRDTDSLAALTSLITEELTARVRTRVGHTSSDTDAGRIGRSPSAVSVRTDTGAIIASLDDDRFFELDLVGARVWDLLATPRASGELAECLQAEYDVDPQTCARELGDLLTALRTHRLIAATE